MSYTMEDLRRDAAREFLDELPPEERLRGLPPEERLRGLPPEERIKGLTLDDILQTLNAEQKSRLRQLLVLSLIFLDWHYSFGKANKGLCVAS